jgi:hypothetical protein
MASISKDISMAQKVISFWKGEIKLHPRSILYASQDRDYDDSKSGLFLEEVKDIY